MILRALVTDITIDFVLCRRSGGENGAAFSGRGHPAAMHTSSSLSQNTKEPLHMLHPQRNLKFLKFTSRIAPYCALSLSQSERCLG